MWGHLLAGTLGLALLSAKAAQACTIVWTPYLQHRPSDLYVVKVKFASVEFFKRVETTDPWMREAAGTIHLHDITCLSRPKGEHDCPRQLDVAFEGQEEGANCPFYPASLSSNEPMLDRYFYLRRSDGKWYVTNGARRLEEL
ncbi:MAG: hypothetical protein J7498_16305 [Sphingobium sp.]|nr:hypothetical protein [Sphingobium sp.]